MIRCGDSEARGFWQVDLEVIDLRPDATAAPPRDPEKRVVVRVQRRDRLDSSGVGRRFHVVVRA